MSSDKLKWEIIARLLNVDDISIFESINEQLIAAGYDTVDDITEEQMAEILKRTKPKAGFIKTSIYMSDDFNAPLDF